MKLNLQEIMPALLKEFEPVANNWNGIIRHYHEKRNKETRVDHMETKKEIILEVLNYCGIEDGEEVEPNFTDWQNKDWKYITDLANEWANDQADIYYVDLYANVKTFSDEIEEYYLRFDKFKSFTDLLQAWQCRAYEQLAQEVLGSLEKVLFPEDNQGDV